MSGASWRQADILCPFYKNDRTKDRMIKCEGLLQKTRTTSTHYFQRQEDHNNHLARYCAARYRECPHFKALMREKYGE